MKRYLKKSLCRAMALLMLVQTVSTGLPMAAAAAETGEKTGDGVTQHCVYNANGKNDHWTALGDPGLPSNATYGANKNRSDVFYPNTGAMFLPDGAQTVHSYSTYAGAGLVTGEEPINPDNHRGVPYRVQSMKYPVTDNDGNPVLDENGQEQYVVYYGKSFKENLKLYVGAMENNPLDTTGVEAVNLSILYGHTPVSNGNNVVFHDVMEVYVSLDGETWLEDYVGIRSSELLSGGMLRPSPAREGLFYRIETENLLDIEGVNPGDTIRGIMIMPFGHNHRTAGEVTISQVAVNAYDTIVAFDRLAPADERKTTYVDPDTLRQIAVDEGIRTATIPWTTDRAVLTQHPGSVGQPVYHYYKPGYTYWGPTYERLTDSTRELFQSSIVDGKYGYNGAGYTVDTAYGMDCQTFVYNCISRVSRTSAWAVIYTASATRTTLVGDLKAIYPITYPDVDVVIHNTEQEIYESYALGQKGDVAAGIKLRNNGGHTRLIKSVHVVRNEDGTIDPQKSYMYFTEQASIPTYLVVYDDGNVHLEKEIHGTTDTKFTLEDGAVVNGTIQYGHSSRHNSKSTFASMYNSAYLVYTLDEYRTGLVEDVEVEAVLGSRTENLHFVAGGANIGISSNYRVISYEVQVDNLDTREEVFDSGLIYCKTAIAYDFNYKSEELDAALAALPNGNYRLHLSVDSGPFTKLGQDTVPRTVKTFDFTVDLKAAEAGDTLYVLNLPKKSGGLVGAYSISNPTQRIAVRYNGCTSSTILPNLFYTVDGQGRLSSNTLYSKPTVVGYHNYFAGYDPETQTLTLNDGVTGHGTKNGCNFTCSANLGNGGTELPMTVTGLPVTTPVADVTGVAHGIATLQDVIDLSATCRIRINHCVVDGTVALFVDEVKEIYPMEDGDVVYMAGTIQPGAVNECFIIKSATQSAGDKVLVNFPATGDYGSSKYQRNGRFWEMKNGALKRVSGVWYNGQPKGTFGYHEQFLGAEEESLTITNATGHTGHSGNCAYNFAESCEYTTKRSGAYEAGKLLSGSEYTVGLTEDTLVIDARTGVKTSNSSLENIITLAKTGEVVLNLYCQTPHVASVVLIIDYIPVMYDITVEQAANGTVSVDKTSAGFGTTVTVTATPDEDYKLECVLVDGEEIEGTTFTVSGEHTVSARFVEQVQPGALLFVTGQLSAQGGTVEAYFPEEPAEPIQFRYTAADSEQVNRFYRVTEEHGLQLAAEDEDVLYDKVYAGYDVAAQILYLDGADGTRSSVPGVAADLPVVDLSGMELDAATVMELAALADRWNIRVHAGVYNGYAVVYAVGFDALSGAPVYMLQNGDSVFVPGIAKAGKNNVGYLAYSGTLPVGTKVQIPFPETGDYAHGYNGEMKGRFWEMRDGAFKRVMSVWYTGAPDGTYGYHEQIKEILDEARFIIDNATGHTGSGSSCRYSFTESCNYTGRGHTSECGEGLPYMSSYTVSISKNMRILDLRSDGTGGDLTLAELRGLMDTGEVVTNLYCATPNKVTVLFVLEHILPTVTPADGDVFYFVDKVADGKNAKAYVIDSATLTPGELVSVAVPAGTGASGNADTANHFWEAVDGALKRVNGIWYETTKYAYGYHDVLKSVTDTAIYIDDPKDGTHISYQTCTWDFDGSCGSQYITRYNECATNLTVDENLLILDLRKGVQNGTATAVTTLAEVKALCDVGNALVNTYVPGGTASGGTAAVMIVVEPAAKFTPNCVIRVGEVTNGMVTVAPNYGEVGTEVTVITEPADGYELEAIYVDGIALEGETFTVTGDHVVTATFKAVVVAPITYAVTVGTVSNGTVTVDKAEAEAGETVTVTATPAEGYRLGAIKVDGVAITGNTFPVTGDHVVTAEFIKLIAFTGSTLDLNESLDLGFRVAYTDVTFDGGYFLLNGPEGQIRVDREDWVVTGTGTSKRYKVVYSLNSKQMTKSVSAVLYNNEGVAVSGVRTDSIRDYAQRALVAYAANEELRSLYANLLVYGATAQDYFSGDDGDSATSQMTAEQLSWVTTSTEAYENSQIKGVTGSGTKLELESRIIMKFTFDKSQVTRDMKAVMTFNHFNGKAVEVVVDGSDFKDESGKWVVYLEELYLPDARQLVTCKILNADGTQVGADCVDSIESYAARAAALAGSNSNYAGLANLTNKMMDFCDIAYNYFANK